MANKLTFLIGVFLLPFYTFGQGFKDVKMYYVSFDKGEANPMKSLPVKTTDEKVKWGHEVVLYPAIEYQTLEGIGGAFNEIGGEALLSLPQEKQDELMRNLFSADKAGFTFCRTAIGASDFGIDAYSYSETPNDYKMKHFSIERDQKYVLPYIKQAFAINPNLTLFGSPWSPPAWMKENNSMVGLTEKNNYLKKDKKVYKAYADYFVKYIKAYQQNGVRIDRICVQNENDANTKYPSCTMPPAQMLDLATNFIIPTFKKENIEADVYAGTLRTAIKADIVELLAMEGVEQLAGVGIQYTSPFIIADAAKKHPNMKMFHTEGHCYNGKNSVEQASHRLEEVADYINSGLTNFCYWNMILNETTESGWEWPQNSLINIDREKKTIQYNPDYNAMYIISRFIQPGDVRIASNSKRPMLTVKGKEGNIKVLIQNTDDKDAVYQIHLNGEKMKVMLPKNSITALVIKTQA
ncbi:glycoside hydrolase family 30 protein [Flammeovirga aprica]|uniref:Glycosyl hydrolase family 30 TIM-barrel domain-containing protein n=1 Tax=Flammeovirga aprica JL-4 TaxID=694437 RepID=A0A7X9P419_9BACT|nr:hypothetical protein [Flammeovirga aprica]NME68352.1 hypothetical protein [Flammeovirga aprica JL-4]